MRVCFHRTLCYNQSCMRILSIHNNPPSPPPNPVPNNSPLAGSAPHTLTSSAIETIAKEIKRYRPPSPVSSLEPAKKIRATHSRIYHKSKKTKQASTESVVHNFSNIVLSKEIISVLSLGLSFTPTPLTNNDSFKTHLLQAFDNFGKSLRKVVTDHRITPPSVDSSITHPVVKPLRFLPNNPQETPSYSRCPYDDVEEYIIATKQTIRKNLSLLVQPPPRNLSRGMSAALKEIQSMDVIIKPADKNLGIVILLKVNIYPPVLIISETIKHTL